ncbi:Biotin synthase, partial [Clarias magur]
RYNRRVDPESDLPYQGLEQREPSSSSSSSRSVSGIPRKNAGTLLRKEERYCT